jgi:hypothetical protein
MPISVVLSRLLLTSRYALLSFDAMLKDLGHALEGKCGGCGRSTSIREVDPGSCTHAGDQRAQQCDL